jgi:NADPH-dependent glutamate synthase beta subunit-like oxidoreductase/NAD(P)H-flavin reductase
LAAVTLVPAFGLRFEDLYGGDGLASVDRFFLTSVEQCDPDLARRFHEARSAGIASTALLLEIAAHLDDFVATLFGIEAERAELQRRHHELAPLYTVKRMFVQRRAAKASAAGTGGVFNASDLRAVLGLHTAPGTAEFELEFARAVVGWEIDPTSNSARLEAALAYAAWATLCDAGKSIHGRGILFQLPRKTQALDLVATQTTAAPGAPALEAPPGLHKERDGFDLTDPGCDLAGALDQAHYCIGCHNQGKDSCSKGLRNRDGAGFQRSPLGVLLAGCPLEERISEFLDLKSRGLPLAALAMIVLDNPMVAATGHRICNDCMKACIYQKQTPVDIPQAETRALRDVLELPWGFEIYGLLTRWNPLNITRPVPRAVTGYKVLVVGLGPAGFTLAHHLLNDGHSVLAVDGLKIEPLPSRVAGVDSSGAHVPFEPVRDVKSLYSRLGERVMGGFGGVAEYGITVRWDKNFLTLARLLLERRMHFSMIGGVRFGGTLTLEDAFEAGFDHVALCMGAGRPTVIPIINGLARGVRQASDFLMALQLTGAARADSIANLQVRLPIIVIGGGLTAVDTATESLAYYPVQVERLLVRYEALAAREGEHAVRGRWSVEEALIADEFIGHARAIRAERASAATGCRPPRLRELLQSWGGVALAYRRKLVDAPCYRLNHEEVVHALGEGVRFIEDVTPAEVLTDAHGHASALRLTTTDGIEYEIPARTLLIAAGTQPNTMLAQEATDQITLDGRHFQAVDENGAPTKPETFCKPSTAQVLTARTADGRFVSFFGDLHPSFSGNVVKAMASAKRGVVTVTKSLETRSPTAVPAAALIREMNLDLRAVVVRVERLTPNIVEIVVRAPRAARRFRPGQFFRLHDFEAQAPRSNDTTLLMEGMALTGASVDPERGLVSVIVLEMGGSSDLCHRLAPGEPVVLMGPTGEPTHIPTGETLCLVGGGLGNAVLFSIGQEARARGNKVIYFAGYKKQVDRYKIEEIEAAADIVVWSCDEALLSGSGWAGSLRGGDRLFSGNVIDSMYAYATGALGPVPIPLDSAERLIVIGSDRMMAAVAGARHAKLAPWLARVPATAAIGSINSPMQCMMKEICGQCLQAQRDPSTGHEQIVFSCVNQDQPLDCVDFRVLRERLTQNTTHEKLSAAWIDFCLETCDSA